MIVLSPRAADRLKSWVPPLAGAEDIQADCQGCDQRGNLCRVHHQHPVHALCRGLPALAGLGRSIGGLPELIARAEANAAVIAGFVGRHGWISHLAGNPAHRSTTSVCLVFDGPELQDGSEDDLPGRSPGGWPTSRWPWTSDHTGCAARIADLVRSHGGEFRFAVADAVDRVGVSFRAARHPGECRQAGEWQMKPRVLVSDRLSESALQIFADRGVEADFRPEIGKDKNMLRQVIGEYDGLAIRSATRVSARLLEGAERLRVIGRAGIGVDNIDVQAASRRGIIVMNTPLGNAVTTAEHAIALMMSLARQIPAADASIRGGQWGKIPFCRHRTRRQDPWRGRLRQYRLGGLSAGDWPRHAGGLLRPVPGRPALEGPGSRKGRIR